MADRRKLKWFPYILGLMVAAIGGASIIRGLMPFPMLPAYAAMGMLSALVGAVLIMLSGKFHPWMMSICLVTFAASVKFVLGAFEISPLPIRMAIVGIIIMITSLIAFIIVGSERESE